MHTYVKLCDGRTMIIYSDNTWEETMSVYPVGQEFDPEFTVTETIPYCNIVKIDTNLAIL